MGYETIYKLTVYPKDLQDLVQHRLEHIYDYSFLFEESCTWYSHEKDTAIVSKEVSALIILDGEGEEAGDIWRKAWLDGEQVMNWKLVYTPPEPSPELMTRVLELEKANKLKRIQKLEAELAKLKEDT